MALRLETHEDVVNWIHGHEGRINALWKQQHEDNISTDHNFEILFNRVNAVEKRIMWLVGLIAGVSAASGAIVGVLISQAT